MDEGTVLDKLTLFGLTRQEACIYICLFKNGELTGYEVAKQTGISRSNVYSGLSGLADKGAAYLMEGNSSKYVAVPVDEFCENKIRSLNKEKEFLKQNIPSMKKVTEGYITIEGCNHIKDKMIHMIGSAEKRIYFSASVQILQGFLEELKQAQKKGRKLVIISDGEMKEQLEEGSICYTGSSKGNQIRLIIDSAYALTGELTGAKEDTCLYTGQANFIDVFKEALRNEIKLIQLTGGKEDE